MNSKPMIFLVLLIILGFVAYLDSPYSFLNKNYSYTASEPVVAQPADQIPADINTDSEEKLVKKENEGGYIVETYREYDVYKDKDGNVIKEVPTSVYDELKYWDYGNPKNDR